MKKKKKKNYRETWYIGNIPQKVARILQKEEVNIAFKTNRTKMEKTTKREG